MKVLVFAILSICSFNNYAKTLWSDFSATLLKGNNYEVGDNERTVFTFEHAAGYSWGDSFIFVDRLQSANGNKETYAEISPRFQISEYKNSFLNNFYIATTAEIGDGFTHYLIGVGTNLKVPHFKYLNLNFYHRNNDSGDNGKQLTATWALPIGSLIYDGFIDYVPSNDDASTSVNFTSQLKYNIADMLKLETKLYLGIEYVYWHNKYGIDGINEKNMNLLVKYHF
ncbi:outer membrane protein OmpK [Thalassotalea profundi]|uniref:Ion channel protein Tsx n=1 Tax=Thalassotalea profundi TaxID=2036687 RepID=A0ABQ3ILP6_9GAMM|nr:outer membrane protein OmpK [Thalassotalea profundi]GHE86562.1 ion channel protein Tsx [Thalassotalea profundi]